MIFSHLVAVVPRPHEPDPNATSTWLLERGTIGVDVDGVFVDLVHVSIMRPTWATSVCP